MLAQRQSDVFAHRHRSKKRAALKAHTHFALECQQLLRAERIDVFTEQFDAAAGRLVQAEQVP